jgi:hypothetical protein
MTAVEWLIDKLTDEPKHYIFLCDKPEYMYGLTKIIQQALEMEKQQIIEACNYGDFEELGEKYYNETYKKINLANGFV